MAHSHFKELSRSLSRLLHEDFLLDAEIITSDKPVQLHKVILAIFSLHIKQVNINEPGIWIVDALGYTDEQVENLVKLLYDGETEIQDKCTEIIKSLHLDLSVDQRIRKKKVSKSKGEQVQTVVNLELKYLRNLTFEIEVPKLLNEPRRLTDVSIRTGKHIHRCHKVILSAMSEYFAVMFASGMKETQDEIITLQGVETETFASVVNYIYSGKSPVTISNAQEILATSVYLQVTSLQTLCEEFLLQHIDVSNCVDIWKFGGLYSCTALVSGAMSFITGNFNAINRLKLLKNLQQEDLVNVISSDNLNINSEDEVLSFVLDWITTNKAEECIEQVLRHVRLTLVEEQYLEKLLKENKLFLMHKTNVELLKQAIDQQKNGGIEVDPRKEKTFVVLKRSSYLTGIEMACYSVSGKTWYKLRSFPSSAGGTGFVACATKEYIYVTGGTATPKSFYQFSIEQNKWNELSEMCEARNSHATGCVNDTVYVLGGSGIATGAFNVVSSIEKYVPGKKVWFTVGNMTIPTYDSAFAVVKSRILIFGGSIGSMSGVYIKDIQCFDTVTETCSTLYHHLPFTLSLAVACVNNRDIYLTCPNGKIIHYNEDSPPTAIDQSKGSQLMGFATLYHNHAIYILGGYSMIGESDAVHKFDLNTKRQTIFNETKVPFTKQTNQLFSSVMYTSRKHLETEYQRQKDLSPRRPKTQRQ